MADRYFIDGGVDNNWNTTGNWSLTSGGAGGQAVPTSSDDVFLDANSPNCVLNVDADAKTTNCTGYTGTLTHNTGIDLTLSGSLTLVAGMTYTPADNTAEFRFIATATLTTGGKLLSYLRIDNNITVTLGDDLSFYAAKDALLQIDGTLNLGGFTVAGNSAINRILISSETLGTSENIVVASGTFANADFRDIALDGATDLSAITGGSGDCGGNTNITFTTGATQYWHVDGGDWSDAGQWFLATNGGGGAGRVPLPQDDVVFDANSFDSASQTVVADMPRIGKSVTWTGTTNSPTWEVNTITNTLYGSLTLVSAMTVTGVYSCSITFSGRGAFTLTCAGNSLQAIDVRAFGGSLSLSDAYPGIEGGSRGIYVTNGTFNTNNFDVTCSGLFSNNSNVRAINLGSSTWNVPSWSSYFDFDFRTITNLTFDAGTSTIIFDLSNAIKRLKVASAGLTFYNLTTTGGNQNLQIEGTNTFNVITVGKGSEVRFQDGKTQTVSSLVAVGDGVDGIILTGTSTAGWTISDASGENSVEYCTISYSTAEGGADWLALTTNGNTDGGNNSGWVFEAVSSFSPFPTFFNS